MRIGDYQLSSNLILAPMAGVTDRPFRQLCREQGAGLSTSEMVSADTRLWGSRKTSRRLDHRGETGPISVQIVGSDPQKMAAAARMNVEHGAQIIDINMGCPAKKVCKVAAGSALLQDEPLVTRILESVVRAVTVPVTLKIRTGWDQQHRNGVRIARIAEEAGIQALAVHGRTRACGFSGDAEYRTIRAIKEMVSIPVIANGDIDSPQKAEQVLRETGADGLMIGRPAQGRPWIFREVSHYLSTGEQLSAPHPDWIQDILRRHLQNLYAFYGEKQGVQIARKHIAWYLKALPDGTGHTAFRQQINRAQTIIEQERLILDFFSRLTCDKEEIAA